MKPFQKTVMLQENGAADPQVQREEPKDERTEFESHLVYRIEKQLGMGGMGTVWKARASFLAGPGEHDDIERDVAIKVVQGSDPNSELSQRLIKEARLTAKLNHENIVRFEGWDYIRDTRSYFFVMEYIRGMDLHGLMELHGLEKAPLQTKDVWRIPDKIIGFLLFSVGNALAYAHNYRFETGQVGILHRDISPGNVLIKTDEGVPKVGDFGIAEEMQSIRSPSEDREVTVCGKPGYIPPEGVANPKSLDARSDLYSLGVLAYELMTGLRPDDELQEPENLQQHVIDAYMAATQKKLVPPHEIVQGIDEDLSAIVCKLLKARQEDRFQGADALVDAVGRQYLFNKRYGPTKAGLREYIIAHQDKEKLSSDAMKVLRFLKESWCSRTGVFQPYRLTKYAERALAQGKNPARI
jgi:serine/threonine-protein kinase